MEIQSKNKLNLFKALKLYKLLSNIPTNDFTSVKLFLDNYYKIDSFPDEFYKMFLHCIHSNKFKDIFKVLLNNNIYDLIAYLKYDNEKLNNIEELINPIDYFKLPTKQIRFIVEYIKKIDLKNDELDLKKSIVNKPEWLLRKTSFNTEEEFLKIAIKMYLTIGTDNAIEVLRGNYGLIDYEIIHYLFNNLNVKNINNQNIAIFNKFLFSNKKDLNNNMRLMIEGFFIDLFLNFDYFYNNLNYFIEQLGNKLNQSKVRILLKERYLSPKLTNPDLSGVVLQDMISLYCHKYGITESEQEIINKNMIVYSKLKLKNKTSIMKVDIPKIENFTFELLPLDDIRNLVMGYKAGNCFRINGEAFMLFNNFLTNPHMRILSISTDENKDFGMVLLMRNGNVLIAQGIKLSNWIANHFDREKLYNSTKAAIKFIMDEMNKEEDEIVASIIGLSNCNTTTYNHDILPFIINPLIDNNHQYYNGIDNYQGLLDLKTGKTLNDIKLFVPSKFYFENNNKIYRRNEFTSRNSTEYREIENILISLRYAKFKKVSKEETICYYNEIAKKREVYTVCTLNWFIRVFEDGFVDSYINSDDKKILKEYDLELAQAKLYCSKTYQKI